MLLIPLDVCNKYGFDPDPLPAYSPSKFGFNIELHSHGKWHDRLKIYNPGIGNLYLDWIDPFNSHPLIEYSVRLFIIEELRLKTSLHGFRDFCELIRTLSIDTKLTERDTTALLSDWFEDHAKKSFEKNEPLYSCIRNYIHFCVEEEFWAFKEELIWRLTSARLPKRKARSKAFRSAMLDPLNGPYNQQEIMAISHAILSETVSTEDRVLVLLCRDLGPRPIQLALLQEEDFISDIRGNLLRVPRVKGFKRSALRRTKNNYTERAISDDLANEIKAHIKNNKAIFNQLDYEMAEICKANHTYFSLPPRPLFPRKVLSSSMFDLYKNPHSRKYTYHRLNSNISSSIREITYRLNITTSSKLGEETLQIGAYRFRRTKATSMVLQGYTPEDVAFALDQSSISSVKHYFRFSRDLIDFVNLAAGSSAEIRLMVSGWNGRVASKREPGPKEIRLTKIDSLGLCSSLSPCEFHPTVTCYACTKFRPYRDANHSKALLNIIEIKDSISENSSGPLNSQLDLAIAMARECIKVLGENDEQPSNAI